MAVNAIRWVRNVLTGKGPVRKKVRFASGASAPVKKGEICAIAANVAAPLAADQAMSGTIVISDCEIISGDLAGFRPAIVPMLGDEFEIELAAPGASVLGTALYYSTSQKLTITAGTNIIAYIVGDGNMPEQGFQSRTPSYDAGTTIETISRALVAIKQSCSYAAALYV